MQSSSVSPEAASTVVKRYNKDLDAKATAGQLDAAKISLLNVLSVTIL